MYLAAIPSAIAFYFLWNPPYDWDKGALFVYFGITLLTVRILISFYEVPNAALAPELAPDYDERTKLLAWRWTFGAVGSFVMTMLIYTVLLVPSAKYPVAILNRDGYSAYGLVAAVVVVATILISAYGTSRFIPWLNRPQVRAFSLIQTVRDIVATLSNRNFLVMFLSALIGAVGTGLSSALILYINTYFWQFSARSVGFIVGAGVLSSLGAFFVAPWVSRIHGKRNAAVGLFMLSWLFANGPLVLGLLGVMPAAGTVPLFAILIACQFITGVFAISGFIIASSMLADVVEDSQVKTGRRSEGLLMSADTILQKALSGVGTFLAGVVVALAQFPIAAKPGAIDPEITARLVLYSLPLTALVTLVSIWTLMFYRIDRATHEKNLATVAQAQAPS
jgi:Na+/melibiose symporter-like transporter